MKGYPPSEKGVRRGCWVTNPFYKRGTHWEGANRMEYSIQELVKKIDCWRFWGYCLVASYQYYRICATFMIKRQRWVDVHRHLTRLFPEGESTPPQEVLMRLRSRRRPLPTICEESASEDEDERESVGSRAPGTETDVLSDTPAHGPGRVTTDPSLQELGTASRQLGSADDVTFAGAGACASGTGDALDVFLELSPVDGSQECPQMVTGQGATSSLTDLVDDEAKCIVCLHGAEDEASVNEDMPSAVRYILETTTRLIREMGEYVPYPSGMHWLDCCHQPIHMTCMIRSFYRMEEWKCLHCRRTLASGLWGPIENVKIDPSLWPPSTFQNLDAFVQRRLTLTDHELFHLMQTWDEEEEDVLIGL